MIDVLAPGGALSRAIPGYEDRPQQRAMARAVAEALDERRVLLAEAGTGTGKTLAYLVPAILSGKRVIISTGTRTLQEQIARSDLPLVRDLIERRFSAVTLKGISNYVCRRKLAAANVARRAEAQLFSTERDVIGAIASWAKDSPTGDRAEVDWLEDGHPAWEQVTTTPDARVGPRCPFHDACFVTKARRAAETADIILVNHHLLMADLALRASFPGARVLPSYDAVIIDEAHQLEEVATEHFGVGASTTGLGILVRDARADAAARQDAPMEHMAQRVDTAAAAALFRLVRRQLDASKLAESSRVELPRDLFEDAATRDAWLLLDTALDEVAGQAEMRAAALEDAQAEPLRALSRRAGVARDALAAIAEARSDDVVTWGEALGERVALRASPVDVGPILRRELFEPVGAVVLTSATMTAEGSFRYARDRLRLDQEIADEIWVDSPFDWQTQALLYLARDLPDPRDERFGEAAAARIRELLDITCGRALVLFTSHRGLRDAATRLRGLPYPLLIQGAAPRATLLDRFRATTGSVLLATGGFWEGVDVPGEALSQVIIDKLPFAPPADPLIRARMAMLEASGKDPFHDYQVPQAAIALRQGIGRLIRRQDDRGLVSVLDRRVLGKTYGRAFLASLPAALGRTASIEQARRWWTR